MEEQLSDLERITRLSNTRYGQNIKRLAIITTAMNRTFQIL
jgi:hypothetical protein